MSFFTSADALYGTGVYGTASYGRVTGIVQLSSVSATGQVTAADPTISKILVGVSATGHVNAVTLTLMTMGQHCPLSLQRVLLDQ